MARKVLNNVVEFSACGKTLKMRFSDRELFNIRHSSIHRNGDDMNKRNYGFLYNFSIYALFDYVFKSPAKSDRFMKTFPYNDFDKIMWNLI